jgi:hypothetical protein
MKNISPEIQKQVFSPCFMNVGSGYLQAERGMFNGLFIRKSKRLAGR